MKGEERSLTSDGEIFENDARLTGGDISWTGKGERHGSWTGKGERHGGDSSWTGKRGHLWKLKNGDNAGTGEGLGIGDFTL